MLERDPNRDPINSENMEQKHDNYRRLLDWLNSWQQNCKKNNEKHNGLSDETFLTLKQTTKCMISLSKYLLHQCNFKYLLTGLIQTDPLQGRFGW